MQLSLPEAYNAVMQPFSPAVSQNWSGGQGAELVRRGEDGVRDQLTQAGDGAACGGR